MNGKLAQPTKTLSIEEARAYSKKLIKQAIKEVNLIKKGKLKGIPARDLLKEL